MGILKRFRKKKKAGRGQTETEKYVSESAKAAPIRTKTSNHISHVSTFTSENESSNDDEVDNLEEPVINSEENVSILTVEIPTLSIQDDESTPIKISNRLQGVEISFSADNANIGTVNIDKFLTDLMDSENGRGVQNEDILSSSINSECSLSSDDYSDARFEDILSSDDNQRSLESGDDTTYYANNSNNTRSPGTVSTDSNSSLQALYRYVTCKPLTKTSLLRDRNSLIDDVSTVGSCSNSCDSIKQNSLLGDNSLAGTKDDNRKGLQCVDTTSRVGATSNNNIERSSTEKTVKIRNSFVADVSFKDEGNPSKGGKIRSLIENVCTT